MATPLAIRPRPSTQHLPVALELLRGSGAASDELTALSAAGTRVELAWASSTRPEWMMRLAWLLGVDRRALILLLARTLEAAASDRASATEATVAIGRAIAGLPAWALGEMGLDELLEPIEALSALGDSEPDPRHPSAQTLLCWSASLSLWAADAAEHSDLLRWRLARGGGLEGERDGAGVLSFPGSELPTLPELMREGADNAAAALRFACDAHGTRAAGAADLEATADALPWSARARAARRSAEALRELLPAGELMRRLAAARFATTANWID